MDGCNWNCELFNNFEKRMTASVFVLLFLLIQKHVYNGHTNKMKKSKTKIHNSHKKQIVWKLGPNGPL